MLKQIQTIILFFPVFFFSYISTSNADIDWPNRNRLCPLSEPDCNPRSERKLPREVVSKFKYRCKAEGSCGLGDYLKQVHACSLVVMRKGKAVIRQYSPEKACQKGLERDLQGIASITKSLTSVVFGRYLLDPTSDRQLNVGMSVSPLLKEAGLGAEYNGKVTLRDLLRMNSGMKWDDQKNKYQLKVQQDKETGKYLTPTTLKLIAAGVLKEAKFKFWKKYNYSGLDSLLLGLILENRMKSQMGNLNWHLSDGLQETFWKTGVANRPAEWKSGKDSAPPAHCCVKMSTQDLAQIGYWILEKYKRDSSFGEDYVSDWIKASFEDNIDTGISCKLSKEVSGGSFKIKLKYGYQWWVVPGNKKWAGDDSVSYVGLGTGGHFLHIIPEHDVVVAQNGYWRGEWDSSKECESYMVHRKLARYLAKLD